MVPIQDMSTGQKLAVVLAVLIEMHLSLKSVPHFLLIDEPVANVDDLNILSMLDLFRELVVTQDCQLFVTTANQNVARLFRRKLMCGRFFGIFVCIPKDGHTLIFCTRNERSRYDWLCFVLCNTCFPPVPASNFRCWSAAAVHCKKRCTPGATQSNRSCWHSDNDASPLPSGWRKRIPWERCHREHLEQKKIALLDN